MVEGTLGLNKASPSKLVPPLAGQSFSMLGQVNLDFHAAPRPGTSLADVLSPAYWGTVCSQLRAGCEIRVIPADMGWYAKLLVLSADSISATVAVIYYSELKQKTLLSADDFEVRLTQNNTKHGVFRKADGLAVKQGFVTEKQALDYLNNYVIAMAA